MASTNETPKNEKPRIARDLGTLNIAVVNG